MIGSSHFLPPGITPDDYDEPASVTARAPATPGDSHTPGFWNVMPASKQFSYYRIFAGNQYIGCVGNSDETATERRANAALIAAAPELLAACRYALSCLDSDAPQEIEKTVARNELRNAIAYATRGFNEATW